MTFDDLGNFGIGVIQTPPSPAGSGTSFTLTTGQGNNFPTVVNGYNVLVWPNPQTLPTLANAELVRVTGKTGDTFTITRQQEGTSARQIQQGDYVALAPTKSVFQAIYNALNGLPTFPGSTVQGDIPFYSALNVLSALAPGTAGQFLQTQGAGANPTWATPSNGFNSAFAAYINSAQNASASSVDTKVNIDTVEFDLGSEFDTTNHKFVAGNTGKYFIQFIAFVQSMADTKELRVKLFKNGSEIKAGIAQTGGGSNLAPGVSCLLSLTAGDYIEFYVNQSDTSARTIVTGSGNTFCSGFRVK